MDVKVQKIETNVVEFEIKVEAKKFGEALNKSYKKNLSKFNVPGFRKGKVPMHIVKKYYGIGVLLEDAINFAIDESYPVALKENNIKPVDYPKIDIKEVEEGKDLVYTAKVVTYPEVELGEYKGLEVKKPVYDVSEEDLEKQLTEMQEKNSRVETKESGVVENGNIAVIDFKGYVDGVAFEGGEGKDFSLEIGSKTFIDTFEEQLIGAKVGENKEVNVNFPENYGKEELNGKPALFEVSVKEVKVKELPALDDEFAKEVSEFDTIAEVKEDLKKKMTESNELKAEREFEEEVVNLAVENAKVEIPEVMVDQEIDAMMNDFEQRLKYQGLSLEQYYQFTGSSADKMKEYMKENAEKKVKTDLVLEKITETENVEVTDEEVKEKAKEIAKMYSAKEDDKMIDLIVKSQGELIRNQVKVEKTVKLLVESVK
ncbi:trigger factor [Inconstantimicrobium mannanitabidum]|uniref:Trigger factor n=1 Tax=Inconstantimicrobium mannanitabidum TaxID=1604901 RepID=A0ACB5RDS7_9CLOT|nr:trigger factor [Clostridium sp. TW13]GKX66919.1 trigger factor [Clostridium sp. TW13]